jgi:alcohol dehydrogenase, propanol-preferring
MVSDAITVPKTQKAQLNCKFGLETELTEIPVPEPKDDELLVHLLYSGVCHSDGAIMKNTMPMLTPLTLPFVVGHEGAGIVVKIGKEVTGFKEGDRVGINVGVCKIVQGDSHEPVHSNILFFIDIFQLYFI